MGKRERESRAGFPSRASLEASFPDDVDEEFELVKRRQRRAR